MYRKVFDLDQEPTVLTFRLQPALVKRINSNSDSHGLINSRFRSYLWWRQPNRLHANRYSLRAMERACTILPARDSRPRKRKVSLMGSSRSVRNPTVARTS